MSSEHQPGQPPEKPGIAALVRWLRRVLSDPVTELDERGRQVRAIMHAMRRAGASLERDDVFRMAAALTYRTIFSLIPVLVLSLVVIGRLWSPEDVERQLEQMLDFLNLAEIQVREEASPDAGEFVLSSVPETTDVAAGQAFIRDGVTYTVDDGADGELGTADDVLTAETADGHEVLVWTGPDGSFGTKDDVQKTASGRGASARTVSGWVEAMVSRVSNLNLGAIGFIGVLILVYAAMSLVVEVERCFNQVYATRRARNWLLRIPQYWLVLTVGPTLIVAGFYIGEQFQTWVTAIAAGEGADASTSVTVRVIGQVVTISISWLMLFMLYRFVPNARVKMGTALIGSFLAAVTWEVGKLLFRQYLQGPALITLYGSLALLPLFLLWVYVTWGVVLFGLKVSYLLQHFAGWKEDAFSEEQSTRLVGPTIVLTVMAEIGSEFRNGRLIGLDQLSDRLGMDPDLSRRVLESLAEASLVREAGIEDDDGGDGWTLARPAETIATSELVRVGHELVYSGRRSTRAGATELVDRLQRLEAEAVRDGTLADLVGVADGGGGGAGDAENESLPAGVDPASDGAGA